jgi:hypothetical protein
MISICWPKRDLGQGYADHVAYSLAYGGRPATEEDFFEEIDHDRQLARWADRVGEDVVRKTFREAQTVASIALQGDAVPIDAQPWHFVDPQKIPEREWLLGTTLIRQNVTACIAPGGAGKTALGVVQALSLATGRALLPDEAPRQEPCAVWLVNLEDPREELDRRIAAACLHFGITEKEIGGRLFVHGREIARDFVVAEEGDHGLQIIAPAVFAVKGNVRTNGIDAILVDPFVSSHRVNENDNGQIDRVAKLWGEIAVETKCAVELFHHTRKGAPGQIGFEADDGRGASALVYACRKAITLNRMTAGQGTNLGITDHWRYFRVDDAKQNLSPPAATAVWRRLTSVELGNDRHFGGDNVQVVEAWQWPDDPLSSFHDEDSHVVALQALESKLWRTDPQAKEWAGRPIADALAWDVEDKEARSLLKSIIGELVQNGALKIIRQKDASRREREYVVATSDAPTTAEDIL